jgi:hypothetical protein
MQANYVKLLRSQGRDLVKRDGRTPISSTTSHEISHHVRSPEAACRIDAQQAELDASSQHNARIERETQVESNSGFSLTAR